MLQHVIHIRSADFVHILPIIMAVTQMRSTSKNHGMLAIMVFTVIVIP